MGMKAWNIRDLSISLNAVPLADGGFADDEVFSLAWDEEQFGKYVGADGEVTRHNTNNFAAEATLRYQQTSGMNDRLTALLQADLAPNGGGAGVFKVHDKEGRLVVLAERAWVKGFPEIKAGKTVQVVEWKIDLADARATFVGGR